MGITDGRGSQVATGPTKGGRLVDAAAAIVDTIGQDSFVPTVARQVAALVPLAYLTTYRKQGPAPIAMPLATGQRTASDVTTRCWNLYRSGPWRHDTALHGAVTRARDGGTTLCHLTADRIADRRHRVEVYERHDLIDRLSIVEATASDDWWSVNLFRTGPQGHFADRELAMLEDLAPLLMASVRRHVTWRQPARPPIDRTARLATLRMALAAREPALTPRELDVCARLALGMTFDGIACDLAIAPTSAKTYRNRAFARLGIQYRSQLAPLCWEQAAPLTA